MRRNGAHIYGNDVTNNIQATAYASQRCTHLWEWCESRVATLATIYGNDVIFENRIY